MRRSWSLLLRLLLLTLAGSLAWPASASAEIGDRWALHAGVFDTDGERIPELGIEYRFRPLEIKSVSLVPAVGVSTTEEENAWIYAGLRFDWEVSEHWVVTPHFAVSLYDAGEAKDLGGPVEFRSGLEVSYRFGRSSRVGILFYHLSNADIYPDNPGANTFALKWGF